MFPNFASIAPELWVGILTRFVGAMILVMLLIPILRGPASAMGLVAHPGGRHRHGEIVPLVGGVAIFIGFCIVALVTLDSFRAVHLRGLLTCMAILVAVGVVDDRIELSAVVKLFFQLAVAVLMASWVGHLIPHVGNLFGTLKSGENLVLGVWAYPFTILCVVGVMNALNMCDGLDGLAAGLAGISLLTLMGFGLRLWRSDDVYLMATLVGGIAGFLWFNFPHPLRGCRRVFLGDAGSLLLGFCLAWFAISLSQSTISYPQTVPPIVLVWCLGLFLLDMFCIMVRRLLRGRSPFSADRKHLHHILLRMGLSQRGTVMVLWGLHASFCWIGFVGWKHAWPEWVLFTLAIVVFLVFLACQLNAWRLVRAARRLWRRLR